MSTIRIEQVVAAPPQRVWAAWTTSAGLAAWWWPHLPDTAYAVDARRGGQYRISSAQAGIGVRGRFERVDEPRELVFSWVWLTGSEEEPEDRVTVGLSDLGTDTTRVVVTHQMRSGGSGEDYRQGWSDVLARLGDLVGAPG
jgi:uncharacterized protein YndB with AHSA1/START domain